MTPYLIEVIHWSQAIYQLTLGTIGIFVNQFVDWKVFSGSKSLWPRIFKHFMKCLIAWLACNTYATSSLIINCFCPYRFISEALDEKVEISPMEYSILQHHHISCQKQYTTTISVSKQVSLTLYCQIH